MGRAGLGGPAAGGRIVEGGAVTDPAGLQVLAAALRGVAEEMGAALVRSAHSANIKERRDCSTAVFDRGGRMIAQAEHMPVHLGAMPDAVAAVRGLRPRPGAVYVLNDPYTGGTHLPDITLVSVVDDLGLVCSRAHHADVGGMQPASMPAGATELIQEGVVIPPVELTDDVRRLLVANMRKPAERLADLRAQEACMLVGAVRLRELAKRLGRRRLAEGMDELYRYSERRTRAAIGRLPDGRYRAADVIEGDGISTADIRIEVEVEIRGDELVADFTGTAPQQPGNVNCPLSVTRSAVYYVVRAVCDPDIPASGGAFAPVTVRAPEGCLVNARSPAAVVAGNTETSSRIVDVVMSALGEAVDVPAHGQGTMNNVTFGTPAFTYYETLGGGQGGSPAGPGPERRARGDVQHAEHADRGARAGVPAADRALRAPPSHRGRRPPPRGRRRGARLPGARGLPAGAHDRAPPPRPPRRGGRRAGHPGPQPAERPPAARQVQPRPARRRRPRDPHPRRRRLG